MPYEFVLIVLKEEDASELVSFVEPKCIDLGLLMPYRRDYLAPNQIKYASKAAANIETNGVYTRACEAHLLRALQPGSAQVIITPSCTAALEMAAMACDLQPGDEVIMPSYTFTSTANAFVRCSAVPVFVDVNPDTLNIDTAAMEAAITSKTRAIVVVHYAGVSCDMDCIMAVASAHRSQFKRHGEVGDHELLVIEDAAHAYGSTYKGKPLGTIGHMGCFSFHYTKNICCGEGGAISINRVPHGSRHSPRSPRSPNRSTDEVAHSSDGGGSDILSKVMIIQEKGTNRHEFINKKVSKYHWIEAGGSFLISEPTAAVLFAQLEDADAINGARVAVDGRYREGIRALGARAACLRVGAIPPGCGICGHIFFVVCDSSEQSSFVRRYMNDANVQVFSHYLPLHSAPAGRRLGRSYGELPVTAAAATNIVRLPMAPQMAAADTEFVIATLAKALSAWAVASHQTLTAPDPSPRSIELPPSQAASETAALNSEPAEQLPVQYLGEVHVLSREKLETLLSCALHDESTLLAEMRRNLTAGDAYVIPDAIAREQLLRARAYLAQVGGSSLPGYQPIMPGATDHHRLNVNDERAYVRGCFHQFSFFPWNQNVLDLFSLFRPVFELKNLLSGLEKGSFLGRGKDGQDGCCARLSFQHYPSGAGHLARHADPVGAHQLVVPLVLMSDKKGCLGAQQDGGYDFVEGGVYLERADGKRVCLDDLGGVGTLIMTNARVVHGVEAIDPIDGKPRESAAEVDWLSFKGRWMAGTFVNKFATNMTVANAVDLSK